MLAAGQIKSASLADFIWQQAKPVAAAPYLEIGQVSTAFYFAWFFILVPFIGVAENTLLEVATIKGNNPTIKN